MLKCVAALACGGLVLVGWHLHGAGGPACPGARLLALLGVDVCCTTTTSAEDKKDDKPALSGTWALKGGELKIEFADKNVMKVFPHGKAEVLAILCSYSVGKDGLVKAKITELEGEAKDKAKDHVPVGLEFNFKWKAKDDTAKLEDVKGENTDVFKSHMEGEYEKK
jgi:hypothetical protein